jgi:hypothetical protein
MVAMVAASIKSSDILELPETLRDIREWRVTGMDGALELSSGCVRINVAKMTYTGALVYMSRGDVDLAEKLESQLAQLPLISQKAQKAQKAQKPKQQQLLQKEGGKKRKRGDSDEGGAKFMAESVLETMIGEFVKSLGSNVTEFSLLDVTAFVAANAPDQPSPKDNDIRRIIKDIYWDWSASEKAGPLRAYDDSPSPSAAHKRPVNMWFRVIR